LKKEGKKAAACFNDKQKKNNPLWFHLEEFDLITQRDGFMLKRKRKGKEKKRKEYYCFPGKF